MGTAPRTRSFKIAIMKLYSPLPFHFLDNILPLLSNTTDVYCLYRGSELYSTLLTGPDGGNFLLDEDLYDFVYIYTKEYKTK